jgi:flavin reductase (DIM6/NTAB) family NADH-FMN oxidoreductase RutF
MRSLPHSVVVLTTTSGKTVYEMRKRYQRASVAHKDSAKVTSGNDAQKLDNPAVHSGEVNEKPEEGVEQPKKGEHILVKHSHVHFRVPRSLPEALTLKQDLAELEPKILNDLRGMTLSSFSTVSLSGDADRPLISFNIRTPSATFNALSMQDFFLIHTLEANQAGADLAARFSRNGGGAQDFEGLDLTWARARGGGKSKSPSSELTACPMMLPLIKSPGVKDVLVCRIRPYVDKAKRRHSYLQMDDHMVVFGSVTKIVSGEGRLPWVKYYELSETEKWHGLGYAEGQYRKIGESITVEPIVREPVVEEFSTEEPVVEVAISETYVIEEPMPEEPMSEVIIEEPVIENPVIEEAVTEESPVEEVITDVHVVEEPSTEVPNEEPVVEKPSIKEPATEEPVSEEPVSEKPIIKD